MVKRGKVQFSLRSLVVLITCVAIALGFISYLRTEPAYVRRMKALGKNLYGGMGENVSSEYDPAIAGWAEPLGLVRLQKIDSIRIENDDFSDEDLRQLAYYSPKKLYITSNKVTDQGVENIAQMSTLRHLSLDCEQVTDDALGLLADLPQLYYLDVSGSSKVSAAFLQQFSVERPVVVDEYGLESSGRRVMGRLSLHGPGIDDRVCQWIAKFDTIDFLDLSKTSISDEGLTVLGQSGIRKIETLMIGKTRVTDRGIEAFLSGHPGVEIVRRTIDDE